MMDVVAAHKMPMIQVFIYMYVFNSFWIVDIQNNP